MTAMLRHVAGLVVLLGWLLAGPALAALTFPALSGRIVDEAGILPQASRDRIEDRLSGLEIKNTTQLVVVTLKSLQGTDIADYGYQLGRSRGIGQKGSNNGALLIVAPNERKVRIEVGYGLEGTLTDAVSRLIIENAILPRFKAGDYPGGVERGVDDIVQVLSGDAEEFQQRAARQSQPADGQDWFSFTFMVLFLGVWLFLFLRGIRVRRRGGGSIWPPVIGGFGGGLGSGSSGGSSWSSGSSSGGGFSGGGGSFGGGGSSGSW